ncbi:MAG: S-adenosylmethionine decarboxylase [Myxococcota bacterium]
MSRDDQRQHTDSVAQRDADRVGERRFEGLETRVDRVSSHRWCRVVLPPDARGGEAQGLADLLVPAGASVVHRFAPVGESVFKVGAHGSVAVHTWPEKGVATVDGYGSASVDLVRRLAEQGWVVLEP